MVVVVTVTRCWLWYPIDVGIGVGVQVLLFFTSFSVLALGTGVGIAVAVDDIAASICYHHGTTTPIHPASSCSQQWWGVLGHPPGIIESGTGSCWGLILNFTLPHRVLEESWESHWIPRTPGVALHSDYFNSK